MVFGLRCPLVRIGVGRGCSGLTDMTTGDDCSGKKLSKAWTRLWRLDAGIFLERSVLGLATEVYTYSVLEKIPSIGHIERQSMVHMVLS